MNVFTLLTNWRSSRLDSVSTPCRCRVLAILLLCLTLGVCNVWGVADYTYTLASEDFDTDDHSETSGTITWTASNFSGTESYGWDATNGFKFGSGNSSYPTAFKLTSSSFSNKIKKVAVTASVNSKKSCKLDVKVGATTYGSQTTINTKNNDVWEFSIADASTVNGAVELSFSSNTGPLYLKKIEIYYYSGSSYTLTFKEWDGGGAASGSPSTGSVTANATSFSFGATAPSKTGHTIEGFYTNTSASSGVKVANSSRQFVASVASWTNASSQYTKGANANLYIKWQADEYTISTDLTNISVNTAFPSSVTYTGSATDALDRTLSVTSSYALPSDLTVTMGGNACTKGTEYSYNSSTGAFSFDVAITGDISISGSAIPYRTITFNDNGSTTVETWLEGSSHATPTITGCTGYDPLGWTTTAPTSNSWASQPSYTTGGNNITVPSSNTTYYAVYTTEGTTPINKFKRVTSSSDLISGEKYVITNTAETYALACNTFYTDKSFPTVSVSPSSGIITTDADKLIYAITGNNTSGYSIYSEEDGGTGIGYDNSGGVLAWYSNGPAHWLITVGESNAVYIQAKKATTKYLQYSSSYYWLLTTETANHLFRQMYNTLYVSNPTCCTALGYIKGSVKVISGTGMTLQWDDISNVSSWAVTGVDVTNSNTAVPAGDIGTPTDKGSAYECAISNLTAGHQYKFTIAATAASGYCDKTQEVTVTTPLITLSETGLSGMSYIEGYGPSTQTKTFTVTAVGLTGNLTVSAPDNFQVSTDNSSWGSSKTISHSSGSASGTVYVRLASGLDAGSYGSASTYVTVSGGSAETKNVSVQGTVSPACENPTIDTQPTASASYNMNVTATALTVEATKNGTGPALTYQWYSNTANSKTTPTPSPIDGATSSSYTPPTTASGTKYYFCEVSSGACAVTTNISAITVSTPTITVSETSRAFGDRAKDGSYEMTFTVSGSTLAKDAGISLAISGTNASLFSIDKTSLSATDNAVTTTTITVTYSPDATGSHSAQIDITSTGATTKTVTLSGTSKNAATVKLHVAGSTSTISGTRYEGDSYSLPSTATECPDMGLYGWYIGDDYEHATTAPTGANFKLPGASATLEAGDNDFYAVYATVTPDAADTYTKITSTDDLVTGDYLIVGDYASSMRYAMKNSIYNTSYFGETSVTISDNKINSNPGTDYIWRITRSNTNVTIKNGSDYAAVSSGSAVLSATVENYTFSVTDGVWALTSGSYLLGYGYNFGARSSADKNIYLFKRDPSIAGPYTTTPNCTTHELSTAVTPVSTGTAVAEKDELGEGKTTTVTATPESGYAFSYWTISGTGATMSNTVSSKSYDNPVTVTMGTADATITAHFAERVAITFNVPTGVTKPDNSYTDVALPTPSGFPSAVDDDCWAFAGWTESSSVNSTSAPATLYPADARYNGEATSAFNLYAVYKRIVFEQIYDDDELEAGDYAITYYSSNTEYALKAELTGNNAVGTDLYSIISEESFKNLIYSFMHNPDDKYIWQLTGEENAWILENGDYRLDLSNNSQAILQNKNSSSATLKIVEGADDKKSLFYLKDATNDYYLKHNTSSHNWEYNAEASYYSLYKLYSSLYMTSPSEPTYTLTWKESGESDDVQEITTCAGLQDSDIPAPQNSSLDCQTNGKFVGWNTAAITEKTNVVPTDLFMVADDAPVVRRAQSYYAVFAEVGSALLSEEFDNTSSSDASGTFNDNEFANFNGTTSYAYKSKYGGVKLGSGSNAGYITSKSLDLSKPFMVNIDAKQYNSTDGGYIYITVDPGEGNEETRYIPKTGLPEASSSYGTYVVCFEAATSTSVIEIGTTAKRAYIDNVVVAPVSDFVTSCCDKKIAAPSVSASKTAYTVTLSWDAVTSANGNASSYEMQWNGGDWETVTSPVEKTSLTPNTEYSWKVRVKTWTGDYYCGANEASNSTTTNQVYTVTYAANGGSGTMTDANSYEAGDNVTVQENTFTYAGYNWSSWTYSPSVSVTDGKFSMPSSNVTITANWSAKALTGWIWGYRKDADAKNNTGDILAIPDVIEAYIGQYVRFDITGYTPSDVLAAKKGYTYTAGGVAPEYDNTKLSYVGADGSHLTYYTTKGLKAGDATLTFTSVGNGELTKTVTIRVKAMPVVKFKDLVHGESFDDVAGTVGTGSDAGIVTITKATPTHSDLDEPGSGNSCEKQHLHLVGWIRSDWPTLVAYLNGTGSAPTTSAITTAGTDGDSKNYYLSAGASLNTETYNGFTFYAVWAKVE